MAATDESSDAVSHEMRRETLARQTHPRVAIHVQNSANQFYAALPIQKVHKPGRNKFVQHFQRQIRSDLTTDGVQVGHDGTCVLSEPPGERDMLTRELVSVSVGCLAFVSSGVHCAAAGNFIVRVLQLAQISCIPLDTVR